MSWLPKSKVVVPVDFSTSSERSIKTALELASAPANVHVIHVVPPLDALAYGEIEMWSPDDLASRRQAGEEFLNAFLKKNGLDSVTAVVLVGDPGLSIAEYADKNAADLIVLPSHGYHGLKRMLLGSVAERVLRHTPCEVLVLHRND
jgi:nucleotide-binding universal stress UspA family protein